MFNEEIQTKSYDGFRFIVKKLKLHQYGRGRMGRDGKSPWSNTFEKIYKNPLNFRTTTFKPNICVLQTFYSEIDWVKQVLRGLKNKLKKQGWNFKIFLLCIWCFRGWYKHGTIIRTGITNKETPCYIILKLC